MVKIRKYDREKRCWVSVFDNSRQEFNSVRRYALERDNYECVECGAKENLHVHHIKELSKGGTNDLDNLVSLCLSCHAEKHKGQSFYNLLKNTRGFGWKTKHEGTII